MRFLDHLAGMRGARPLAPRGRDPLPPPGRVSPLTAWASGRFPTSGSSRSAADGRRSAASPIATSAPPTRTGRTPCSRWPTVAPRRSATPCSTRSPSRHGIHERATLYSSTEFKKIRLLYFTEDFKSWESAARLRCPSVRLTSQSAPLERRQLRLTETRSAALGTGALWRSSPAASTRPYARCGRSAATRSSSIAGRVRSHRRRRQPLHRLCVLLGSADPRARPPASARRVGPRRRRRARASVRRLPARSSWRRR
jgi:hypothetical protein